MGITDRVGKFHTNRRAVDPAEGDAPFSVSRVAANGARKRGHISRGPQWGNKGSVLERVIGVLEREDSVDESLLIIAIGIADRASIRARAAGC